MGLFDRISGWFRPPTEAQMIEELDRLAASPGSWGKLPPKRLEGLLLSQLLLYGKTNDPARIPGLLALYEHAIRVMPVARRHDLLQQVTGAVAANLAAAHTFMPFIIVDPAGGVASSAALNYAVLLPPRDADPLTGPKELLTFSATAPTERVRIAILVGLLLLGDRRVVELLKGCWTQLTPAGQEQLAGAWSGFAYAPVMEFIADWISRMDDREDEAVFGAVAGALARIPLQAQPAAVLEVERVFPATAAPNGIAVIERQRWSFAEFGARIAPALRGVAEREREPRIMPMVLAAWDIAPN